LDAKLHSQRVQKTIKRGDRGVAFSGLNVAQGVDRDSRDFAQGALIDPERHPAFLDSITRFFDIHLNEY
jgi:hypothetical protein